MYHVEGEVNDRGKRMGDRYQNTESTLTPTKVKVTRWLCLFLIHHRIPERNAAAASTLAIKRHYPVNYQTTR